MPMCALGLFVPLYVIITYWAIRAKERWEDRNSVIRKGLADLTETRRRRQKYSLAGCDMREAGKHGR